MEDCKSALPQAKNSKKAWMLLHGSSGMSRQNSGHGGVAGMVGVWGEGQGGAWMGGGVVVWVDRRVGWYRQVCRSI